MVCQSQSGGADYVHPSALPDRRIARTSSNLPGPTAGDMQTHFVRPYFSTTPPTLPTGESENEAGAGPSCSGASKITSVYSALIGEIQAFRLRAQVPSEPPRIIFPKVLDIARRGAISLGVVRTKFERHRLASHPAPSQHMVRDRRSPTHPTVACCLIFRCVVAQVD